MLIDTHSHIYLQDFAHDREEAMQRAFDNGIRKIILPNIDSGSIKYMMDLAYSYPHICYPLIGLHPTSVDKDYRDELNAVEYWAEKERFYGIGETGIDLYWDKTWIKEQKEAFRFQVKLAKSRNWPVIIHVRDSFKEVYSIVKDEQDGSLKGIFHCFSGTLEEAKKITDTGFHLGIGGVVTFKNSDLSQVLKDIDLKNIVLETDSPYLAPVPKRGKRNESSYIIYIAQKLSEVFEKPVEEIAQITSSNARTLFEF